MILYASQTHGRRNLQALEKHGFRILVTPDTYREAPPLWVDGTAAPFAIDNGAWGCAQRGEPFNWGAFESVSSALGADADWIVAPDIVCGGLRSLEVSLRWLPTWDACPVLIAVQDGMLPVHLEPHLGPEVGLAVGGSTPFKERTLPQWGRLAQEKGCYLHVLRVNTRRRLAICRAAQAASVDGTSASIFSKNAPLLERWTRALHKQQTLGIW